MPEVADLALADQVAERAEGLVQVDGGVVAVDLVQVEVVGPEAPQRVLDFPEDPPARVAAVVGSSSIGMCTLLARTTSSTTPRNSCPIRSPCPLGGIDQYGHRSLPQIHDRSTRTSASVGSRRTGSGTFSTRTSPAPYIDVARIGSPPPVMSCPQAQSIKPRTAPSRESLSFRVLT
jgi:hypothetical protein